jgi:hypothetical protein
MKLFYLLIFFLPWIYASAAAQDHVMAGGECEYERIECKAKITSITQRPLLRDTDHTSYEVKFTVLSIPLPPEVKREVEGREFVLLLNNSSYPGPRYLKKYDISIGKVFDCYYHAITRGTCTPASFDFPDIKLDDYFENKP